MNHMFKLLHDELVRQESCISLIASENYTSSAILAATGSVLTNKYAEGYPGKRYYGGCGVVDKVELYAMELGRKLFKCDHINLQPHAGASANFAVFLALLKPGDTVLAMNLAAGGHLTHGHKVNFSGKLYHFVHYGVNQQTQQLDYDEIERLAKECQPKLLIAGASAYSRLMDYERLAAIAKSVGAYFMVDMAHIAGLVAADLIPSPVPHADVVTSTTHKTLRGPRGGMILSTAALAPLIDKAVMPGSQGGPLMHVVAAKGVAFEEALEPTFKLYSKQVIENAAHMAKAFNDLGYSLVAGGTDTHLLLIDLRKTPHGPLQGNEIEALLESCNIIVNRNAIPFDPLPPTVTSGIRLGTPAMTTRGMQLAQAEQLVQLIDSVIRNRTNPHALEGIRVEVAALCKQFPGYKNKQAVVTAHDF
ncbi:serine hydroxymethyltransferase [Candidatus Dependentiae bacterium]|nr:serine hydroxymethyltransferase [Candidatus Dependentiae bacterium]